jgi:uncharacterized protein YceK
MKTKLFSLMIALALAGCAEMPSATKNASADHGPYPSNYEQVVHDWIAQTFFDPHSIQDLTIAQPAKGWHTGAPILGEKAVYYGWEVIVSVNGKNRLGGYTGLQKYDLLLRDGKIIRETNLTNPGL